MLRSPSLALTLIGMTNGSGKLIRNLLTLCLLLASGAAQAAGMHAFMYPNGNVEVLAEMKGCAAKGVSATADYAQAIFECPAYGRDASTWLKSWARPRSFDDVAKSAAEVLEPGTPVKRDMRLTVKTMDGDTTFSCMAGTHMMGGIQLACAQSDRTRSVEVISNARDEAAAVRQLRALMSQVRFSASDG